ncbi:OmpA family protein [Photobacterium nomapromontoriensis]|uniref:OmpA family protein n=1 Tax=Photobacterium nomapromontoriensis TaxID=2910237 RepID=UPI003D0D5ADD
MARAKIEKKSVYLMGQLVGPDGKAIDGNGLYPLPGFALTLPELSVGEGVDDSKSQNGLPLYFSDSAGRLQAWNSQIQSVNELEGQTYSLASSPLLLSMNKDTLKPIYIPPYLIPAAVMSQNTKWTTELKKIVDKRAESRQLNEVDITTIKNNIINEDRTKDKSLRRFLDPDLAKFFINNAEEAEAVLRHKEEAAAEPLHKIGAYQRLYNQLYSGNYTHDFHFVRIPQVWTINLFFSADYFEGAEVTLSGQPENLIIKGDAREYTDKIISRVRHVDYFDIANQDENTDKAKKITQYVATFWITGGHLDNDDQIKQLVRFDIDLNSIEYYWADEPKVAKKALASIAKLGVPGNRYSLSEQVLHLPIYSIAGRSVLVSGDPISVEEALFQHAPETFKGWVDWSKNQPYTSENKAAPGAQPSINILNTLGTYKGLIEASASGVMDPLSMTTVHKAFSAGLNEEDAGDAYKALTLAVGIDANAKSFITFAQELEPPAKGALEPVANLVAAFRWSDEVGENLPKLFTIPPALRQFWHKVDDKILIPLKPLAKAIEFGLDKPFGYAQLVSSGLDIYSGVQNSEAAFKAYIEKSIDYGQKTQSLISTLSLSEEADRQTLLDAEAEHKQALLKAFADESVRHKVLLNGKPMSVKQKAKEGEASYLTLFFDFDSAEDTLSTSDLSLISKVASYLSKTQSEMTLSIEGYTCDIGSLEYNLRLSERRALSLKSAIMRQLGSDASRWDNRIIALGKGEFSGNDKKNRQMSRRAEMKFHLNTAFDYPVCRSWLLALEKNRQKAVSAELKVHNDLWSFAGQAFDIALGFAAPLLGPSAAIAYGIYWSGTTLTSTLAVAEQILQKKLADYKTKQKMFSEFDVVGQALLYRDVASFNELSVLGKAYIKRAIALNGLLRLLLLDAQVKSSYFISEYNAVSNMTPSQSDLDIGGYICTYILNDNWDIGGSWLPSFHLDEAWLETKNIDRSGAESLLSFSAISSYVYYRVKQSQTGKTSLEQARPYQKYCPVHVLADPSLNQLKSFLKTPDLSKLDSKIFAEHLVSVKVEGRWQTIEQLVNADEVIWPTMPVRVLIILDMKDKNLRTFNDENTLNLVPIGVRPIRQNKVFDDIGSYTTEYVHEIAPESLIDTEKKFLSSKNLLEKNTALYGVVISPTYYFGCNILNGIKPIADDYGSKEWKSVFGTPDEQENAQYDMRYMLEVGVPGIKRSEKKLTYRRKFRFKNENGQRDEISTDHAFIFTLAMTREKHSVFYEKSFLARKAQKSVGYPELFSNSNATLFIHDPSVQSLIPGDEYNHMMEALGWTKKSPRYDTSAHASKLLILVSTKAVDDADTRLKAGGFEMHQIPVDVVLKGNDTQHKYKIDITEKKHLYPLGKISVDTKKRQVGFSAKPVIEDFFVLTQFLEKNIVELVDDLIVKEMSFPSLIDEPVDTDLYAMEVPLEYLNVTGKKVAGLRPFISQKGMEPLIWVDIEGKKGLGLTVSSSELPVSKIDVSEPTLFTNAEIQFNRTWYEMDKQEFKHVRAYTASATGYYDQDVHSYSTNKLKHEVSRLENWIKAKPEMKEYISSEDVALSEQRVKMLREWLLDTSQ